MLGWDLFIGERWNSCTLARMLNRDATNVTFSVQIEKGILVEVSRLGYLGGTKLNMKRVRVLKILDLHGVNDRSKNALCIVSPSGNSITLRYLPLASGIGAQRRIRPSC